MDRGVIARVVDLVGATRGPIVELGAGGGALTRPLSRLGRPLTAVELDPHRADALRRELGAREGRAGATGRAGAMRRDGSTSRPDRTHDSGSTPGSGRAHDADRAPAVGRAHPNDATHRRHAKREHGPPDRPSAPHSVQIVTADALAWRFPGTPHVIASNVPFHLTTAILRRILAEPAWTDAVLLTQWEAARRRCGVGGTSQLTVQWAPWFEFALDRRVPARAFRPAPAVDGGLFTIRRRPEPLVPDRDRRAYQAYVASVFGGRGRGLAQVLSRATRPLPNAKTWLARRGIPADALPARLAPADWSALWHRVRPRA